jgi:hypothetical protein
MKCGDYLKNKNTTVKELLREKEFQLKQVKEKLASVEAKRIDNTLPHETFIKWFPELTYCVLLWEKP